MHYHPIELGDAGALAPGRWRWARALGWMVVLLAAVAAALSLLPLTQRLVVLPKEAMRGVMLVAEVLAYTAYALLVRYGERRRPSELALRALPLELAIGLAIGAGMFLLVFASLRLAGAYTLAPGDWNDWGRDIVIAASTALHEELIARLIIFRLLMRAFGVNAALAASALLFGAAHLANPGATYVAALAIAVEAGLMLAAVYLLTGRIWMAVGVHAAWNFTQGAIFGASVSGFAEKGSLFVSAPIASAPAWLSGGRFGPEASLSAVIVGLAVFVTVLARTPRPRSGGQGAGRSAWASAR